MADTPFWTWPNVFSGRDELFALINYGTRVGQAGPPVAGESLDSVPNPRAFISVQSDDRSPGDTE